MDTSTGPEPVRPATIRPPAWRLLLAIAIPLIAVAVIALLAKKTESSIASDPAAALAVAVVPQPASTAAGCAGLDAALPADLDGRPRRTMLVSEPGVAAWGDPPAVLRCGISDPDELTCSSALTVINGVAWLQVTGTGSTTYIAVDRSVRVALTLDDSVGVGSVQALSNVLKTVLAERAVCVDGTLNLVDTP